MNKKHFIAFLCCSLLFISWKEKNFSKGVDTGLLGSQNHSLVNTQKIVAGQIGLVNKYDYTSEYNFITSRQFTLQEIRIVLNKSTERALYETSFRELENKLDVISIYFHPITNGKIADVTSVVTIDDLERTAPWLSITIKDFELFFGKIVSVNCN